MNFFRFSKCGSLPVREFILRFPRAHSVLEQNETLFARKFSSNPPRNQMNPYTLKSTRNYVVAIGILTLGLAYAAVPLYRIFCQSSGYGGTAKHDIGGEKIQNMKKMNREIKVKFNSDVSASLNWQFKPQQREIKVFPGETALAFYTATNPLDVPIIGISTYNILPYEAAPYFNKIQCFCFEEQRLNPHEQVDMPVFFYIDPEFCEDPAMEYIDEIILSYTFFEAKEHSTSFLNNIFPGVIKSNAVETTS